MASCLTIIEQDALRLLPSAVLAVIVAFPADIAVTKPEDETVATFGLLVDHVTLLSSAFDGRTVADNCKVSSVYKFADVLLSEIEVAIRCLTTK